MISRLSIRNYQSLQSVDLKLGRITILVGPSDTGKTAVLRALERACFNESAYDFLTAVSGTIADKASVSIDTDRAKIIWERTKTAVQYRLVVNGVEEKFTKMGRSKVPDEVQRELGVRELQIDSGTAAGAFQRIQFVGQFDPPFLVGDRGGVAAARVLGHLTGVHIFSNANKRAYATGVELNRKLEPALFRKASLEKEVSAYEGIEDKHRRITIAIRAIELLKQKQVRLNQLKRLAGQKKAVTAAKRAISDVDGQLNRLDSFKGEYRDLWNRLSRFDRLVSLASRKNDLRDFASRQPKIPQLPDLVVDRNQIDRLARLKELKSKRVELMGRRQTLEEEWKAMSGELSGLEKEVVEFSLRFPLCPFEGQFDSQQGSYRCNDLMRVVNLRTKPAAT